MPTSESLHVSRLKARAKALQRAVTNGDEVAVARVRNYFGKPDRFKLSHAQLVIAREMRVASWRKLIEKKDWVGCSFCRKWQYEVRQLIAGPDGVFVCDQCVARCSSIIEGNSR